tara:strand:- start:1409 stop:1762 length:354 start_codon:yes stop_codon:yes gene_type:complete
MQAMKPLDTTLDRLEHVAFQVDDLDAALAWYRDLFSVETVYEDDTWAMLSFDNINLALVTQGQHPPHIAVEHDDATQFGALAPHRDGTASVYILDPAGNAVEILQRPETSTKRSGCE